MTDEVSDSGNPVDELAEFADLADESLPGRVRRGINRRLLVGDAVDLGLGAMVAAAWHYIQTLVEILTPGSSFPKDGSDE